MGADSLTQKTFKNISYRFIAYLWPMFFTIFITPVIVFRLGVREYGIYIFISTITGFLSLLDLGVSFAVIKFLASYQVGQDDERVKKLIFSANSLFFIIGSVGFAMTILLSHLGEILFASDIPSSNYAVLFVLAGLGFFVSSINNIYNLIPDALQRFDISSKLNIIHLTTSSLVNLAVVLLGFKLMAIFVAQLVITLIFALVRRHFAIEIMPLARYRLAWNRAEIKSCYRYGLATVINGTANSSLAYLDRLIIPLFVGPSQLTYYSLPGNAAARIPGVTDNLSGIIFPISANIDSAGNEERLRRLYVRSVRLITVIASAISLAIIFLAREILTYWLDASFAEKSTSVLILLTITNFIIALQSPVNSFFFGLGRLKFASVMSLAMAVLNALLLLILLPRFGITGAAWSYLISVLPIFYVIYYIEHKYLKLAKRRRYYLSMSAKIGSAAVIFFPITKFFISPLITDKLMLIILGPISVIIFVSLYWVLGFFEKEDVYDVQKFLNTNIQKVLFPSKNIQQ